MSQKIWISVNHVQMENTIAIPFQNMLEENPTNFNRVVHSDVFGKIEKKSLSGCEYFVTFIEDKSRYVWTYMLKHKEVFKKFIEGNTMVEKSSGHKVKYYAQRWRIYFRRNRKLFEERRYSPWIYC